MQFKTKALFKFISVPPARSVLDLIKKHLIDIDPDGSCFLAACVISNLFLLFYMTAKNCQN